MDSTLVRDQVLYLETLLGSPLDSIVDFLRVLNTVENY
jgi:hypothetical protein